MEKVAVDGRELSGYENLWDGCLAASWCWELRLRYMSGMRERVLLKATTALVVGLATRTRLVRLRESLSSRWRSRERRR